MESLSNVASANRTATIAERSSDERLRDGAWELGGGYLLSLVVELCNIRMAQRLRQRVHIGGKENEERKQSLQFQQKGKHDV